MCEFTWLYLAMWYKKTGANIQTIQDKDSTLLLENIIRRGISSIMWDRYVKSDEKKRYCIMMLIIYMFGLSVNL